MSLRTVLARTALFSRYSCSTSAAALPAAQTLSSSPVFNNVHAREYGIALGSRHQRTSKKEAVVVLGTGWAAYRFMQSVDYSRFDVKVVSPRNHFLFTPLLCSTAVGTLPFRSIMEPIRTASKPLRYFQAKAMNVDTDQKVVHCVGELNQEEFDLSYDRLVIACGARNATFGVPGVSENALFMKQLDHARQVRNRIIACFETASMPTCTPEERARILTFVVVGGGPTAIELCAELSDFLWEDLVRAYPEVPLDQVKVEVLEGSPQILSMFEKSLVARAVRNLKRQGVQIHTNSAVTKVTDRHVELADGQRIPYGCLIWAAGIGPVPLIDTLCQDAERFPHTKQHRLLIDEHLRVKGHTDVYAVGDCAVSETEPLMATAQVAHQQGAYLAEMFSKPDPSGTEKPFKFKYLGLMAYIGRYQGLMETPDVRISGLLAWLSWRSVYLTRLGTWKSKIQVPFDWFRTFVFGRDVTTF